MSKSDKELLHDALEVICNIGDSFAAITLVLDKAKEMHKQGIIPEKDLLDLSTMSCDLMNSIIHNPERYLKMHPVWSSLATSIITEEGVSKC